MKVAFKIFSCQQNSAGNFFYRNEFMRIRRKLQNIGLKDTNNVNNLK